MTCFLVRPVHQNFGMDLPVNNFLHSLSLDLLAINPQSTVFLVVFLFILLLLSFIISGAEVALFSLPGKDINMLKTKQHVAARRLTTLLEERKAVYTTADRQWCF